MSGDTKASCLKNSEDAIRWAVENDLIVVLPTPYELLLDIDTGDDRRVFAQNLGLIQESYGVVDWCETYSRSGNTHIIVTLKTAITPVERIALQTVLGSDRRREAHSLRRVLKGERNPTLFFEKKVTDAAGSTVPKQG
jgi:hypothetical protein